MSVTADHHDPACKPLEEAGFTDAQIAALSEFARQRMSFGAKTPPSRGDATPHPHPGSPRAREGSIGQVLAMLVLALAGLGALLTILIRVA